LRRIHCAIGCELAEVNSIAAMLRDLCASLGFDEIDAYQVELAACEAMVNVIRHAYRNEPGKTMMVGAGAEDGRLVIEIEDRGVPMPAERVRDLKEGVEIAEVDSRERSSLRESGRGLQIIHDVMDEISYESEGGMNRLRMGKLIAAARREEQ